MNNHLRGPSAQSEDGQSLLLLLEEAQNRFGYLSEELMGELAESLGISAGDVYGVATFYSFLTTRPKGRNVIRICKGLPCCLKDYYLIVDTIEKTIGIKPGETSPDNRFSLELTNCIGACNDAPAMLVNNNLHTGLTSQKISEILESYD